MRKSNKSINGTSLKGYLSGVTYAQLEEKFGAPDQGDDYKVAFEWCIEDDEGNVATIYPWKNTALYDESLPSVARMKTTNTEWNIGGHTSAIVDKVQGVFKS